jgi:hypothetical protein
MNDRDSYLEDEPELEPQPLVPITAMPLPFGPSKKNKPKKVAKVSADRYRKALQQLLYRVQMPMTSHQLVDLDVGQLRAIASLFKAYDGNTMRGSDRNELIRFISGYQQEHENYRPLERLPGVVYPPIDDQDYRALFEKKVDPWKRPKRD